MKITKKFGENQLKQQLSSLLLLKIMIVGNYDFPTVLVEINSMEHSKKHCTLVDCPEKKAVWHLFKNKKPILS